MTGESSQGISQNSKPWGLQRHSVLFPNQQNENMQNHWLFKKHSGKCQLWKQITLQELIFMSFREKKKKKT